MSGRFIRLRNVVGPKNITGASLIAVNRATPPSVPWHSSGFALRSAVGRTVPVTTQLYVSSAAPSAHLAPPTSRFSGRPVDLFRSWPRGYWQTQLRCLTTVRAATVARETQCGYHGFLAFEYMPQLIFSSAEPRVLVLAVLSTSITAYLLTLRNKTRDLRVLLAAFTC